MLQQTRVEAVIPYYNRFLAEIPSVAALAAIGEDRLLKLWQGLGYYSRVLNLKQAAVILMEQNEGLLPHDFDRLRTLPGIGEYTAGAIASIAFGQPVPAVDGNVLRVLARLTACTTDIRKAQTKKAIRQLASALLTSGQPGDFNQALMELGATICLPAGQPRCDCCPVNRFCKARQNNLVYDIPVRTGKKARTVEERTVFVIICCDRYAICKRPPNGLLSNLWEFPNQAGKLKRSQCLQYLTEQKIEIREITRLNPARHIFSHLEWHMSGYYVQAISCSDSSGFVWATREEIEAQYSIPTAFGAFLKIIKV